MAKKSSEGKPLARPYCRTCKNKRMVLGTTTHGGRTYEAMVDCPDCKIQQPVAIAPPKDHLDHAERAAGERQD